MNTDPITAAVVAALREARDWAHPPFDVEAAATALLRDLARLQRPVAHRWHWAGTHGEWQDGPGIPEMIAEISAREGYRLEYAYSSLPGADAS